MKVVQPLRRISLQPVDGTMALARQTTRTVTEPKAVMMALLVVSRVAVDASTVARRGKFSSKSQDDGTMLTPK